MNSKDFCYWLQGFFEINGETEITAFQSTVINDHLKLVFDKETPNRIEPGSVFDNPIEPPKFIC